MANENNDYYKLDPGFQIVSRKGRGKKKWKSKAKYSSNNSTGDSKSESDTLELGENSNVMDDVADVSSGVEDSEEVTYRDILTAQDSSNTVPRAENRVSLDAMMNAPPEYAKSEEVMTAELKTLESSLEKFNMEDESVFTESSEPKMEYVINKRALPKEATTYELEKFEKNALIIFNQENIEGHQRRLGTEQDVEALTSTFGSFGFEVTPHKDLTHDELFKELKTFSEKDFTDYGCVAVAVLTHGSNNGLLRAKDQQYSEIKIINHFKDYSKSTLVTKPKLIIIQACRGTKIKEGVPVFRSGKIRKDLDEEDLEPYILPVESDLLILHSSYVGSPSHRNELHGSWFIQALCNKINALSTTHDLESIITEVKREVAINKQHEEYNRRTFEMDINKQMPVMTSTLIRKLYLKRFGDIPKTPTFVDRARRSSDSKNQVLDASMASSPGTPLLIQFGPCNCFLDHFTYMRNCLRYFVEENPHDVAGQSILDVANTFEDGVEFNTSKDRMCKAISYYLMTNARSSHFYKYLYFYNSPRSPPQTPFFNNKN
ncbi:caspase-8 [Helicoverpa armigera]|uniref:caspase-8 n=1 Tax=Helicoverpa armigera TaxID=29058 RepID=UPI003082AF07